MTNHSLPEDRHVGAVSVEGIALVDALELWATRPDNPDAYTAAAVAVDHIDTMLDELHQLRARLVAEHRQFHGALDGVAGPMVWHRAYLERGLEGPAQVPSFEDQGDRDYRAFLEDHRPTVQAWEAGAGLDDEEEE